MVCLHACLSVCMFACLHPSLSVCLSARMPVCLQVRMLLWLSVCPHACVSACLYVCVPVLKSVSISACLPAFLSVFLLVCLSVSAWHYYQAKTTGTCKMLAIAHKAWFCITISFHYANIRIIFNWACRADIAHQDFTSWQHSSSVHYLCMSVCLTERSCVVRNFGPSYFWRPGFNRFNWAHFGPE
jgi:hypothetical protein